MKRVGDLHRILGTLGGLYARVGEDMANIVVMAVFPGCGEDFRVHRAVDVAEDPLYSVSHLCVLGTNTEEREQGDVWDEQRVRSLYTTDGSRFKIFVDPVGENTYRQVGMLMDFLGGVDASLGHVAVVTSFWHMPRVYLTVVKEAIRRGQKQSFLPFIAETHDALIDYPLHTNAPEYKGLTAFQALDVEFKKIETYQQKGDVATWKELANYLRNMSVF